MALTIYGTHRSRTMRVLWIAAELGLEYEHVPLAVGDPALREPWFLGLNPVGRIPTIVDDGFALSESLAITLYLAKRYGSEGEAALHPRTPAGEAESWRWTLWAQGHLEPWLQRDAHFETLRQARLSAVAQEVATALRLLEGHLQAHRWLVDERFTVADLNVASVLSPSRTEHLDLTDSPAVRGWLDRCRNRPAALATRSRFPT